MPEKNKRGLITDFLLLVFVRVPVLISDGVSRFITETDSWVKRMFWITGLGAGFIFGLAGLRWIFKAHYLNGKLGHSSGWFALVLVYGLYVLAVLPAFVIYTSMQAQMRKSAFETKGEKRKRKITAVSIAEGRKTRKSGETYLGKSYWTGKPVLLTEDMRLLHSHVVGSTGSGKTESVLLTFLRQDIEDSRGAVIIDAKGDLELREKIREMMQKAGREKDFLYFSLSHPGISDTYNPLMTGSATEIKDKIIGATEWTEEFYKKRAEEACLTLLNPMISLGMDITFRNIYKLLTDQKELIRFKDNIPESSMRDDLDIMVTQFSENTKYLSGFIADIALVTKSEFSRLVDVKKPEIDLDAVYESKKVVYFSLNTQGFEETAKRFGRLILQDIKTFSNRIQTGRKKAQRIFFPVYVDEFSSFVYESFIELLNKARSSSLAIMILHQSMGDLMVKRASYQQQVLENTNIKIIMRQDDPDSVEKLAKMGGSEKVMVSTYQTEKQITGTELTGLGSMREGMIFRIDPDLIRTLGRGEAIVVRKFPKLEIDYVKLDYAGNDTAFEGLGEMKPEEIPETPILTLQDNFMQVRKEAGKKN